MPWPGIVRAIGILATVVKIVLRIVPVRRITVDMPAVAKRPVPKHRKAVRGKSVTKAKRSRTSATRAHDLIDRKKIGKPSTYTPF
jgi:hypothetical protein